MHECEGAGECVHGLTAKVSLVFASQQSVLVLVLTNHSIAIIDVLLDGITQSQRVEVKNESAAPAENDVVITSLLFGRIVGNEKSPLINGHVVVVHFEPDAAFLDQRDDDVVDAASIGGDSIGDGNITNGVRSGFGC